MFFHEIKFEENAKFICMNEQQLNWDDMVTVMSIADGGSLSAAARHLGISHATVFRRLGKIEDRLGVRLFERSRTGYVPTLAGEELAALALRVDEDVRAAERRFVGQDQRPDGTVRVTTADTLMFGPLHNIFADFRRTYPEIELEVILSNEMFNLSKRMADVAIRPTTNPPENLVGRAIIEIAFAVYAAPGHPVLALASPDFTEYNWIGLDDSLAQPVRRWMIREGYDDCVKFRVNSLVGCMAAAKVGLELAVLPCFLAEPEPDLVRVTDTIPELSTPLWLLTHPDLRRVYRIRTFLDFVAKALSRQKDLFAGEP